MKTNKLPNQRFTVANSKVDREKTADRSIRVTDIPLYIKSEVIRSYYDQYGDIDTFSIDTRGTWQVAYITYKEQISIRPFYDTWSVSIMDFQVRAYPQNLFQIEYENRTAFTLKLS